MKNKTNRLQKVCSFYFSYGRIPDLECVKSKLKTSRGVAPFTQRKISYRFKD